jgi:hypothetical protein
VKNKDKPNSGIKVRVLEVLELIVDLLIDELWEKTLLLYHFG